MSTRDARRFEARRQSDWDEAAALQARAAGRGLKALELEELERLATLHRRVMADFAWVRTHLPGSALEARLRPLAFGGHRLLAARPPAVLPRLRHFLTRGYPALFQESAGTLLTSVGIFSGASVLGFVLTSLQLDFATLWLGAEAIDQVRQGAIWTDEIGHVAPPSLLSTKIFTNNISVALVSWAGGAVLGLGSLYVLTMNGMMFGAVLALTAHYGMLDRLFAFISAHGPLELFLITVSAAAGLELARGQLSWRNRPRAETLPEAGRRSVQLLAGTIPWFVVLGLVEGNLSPVMTVPTAYKMVVGVVLVAAFLLWALRPLPRAGAPS